MGDPSVNDAGTALRHQLDHALAVRDREGAVSAALEAVRSGSVGIEQLYGQVLMPLLKDTGAAWQNGETQVWEEHYATATVRTIVEALYPDVTKQAAAVRIAGRVAVLACPPGEAHDLGLRMLSDRMALHGWESHYLGADTPAEEIASAARELGATLVVLSAATHYNRALLRTVVDHLKKELPGVRIGVGGPAFAHDRSWPADELLSEAELGLWPGVEPSGE
jgi:methanogenic corrinoid protein MtbC1